MDIIRWIEAKRFNLADYNIISFMIGRADVNRSRQWFAACMEELLKVATRQNHRALYLLGAVIPAVQDTRFMIKEFVACNVILQNRCHSSRDRFRLEYTRPGKVLLSVGGPLAEMYGEDGRLSARGRIRFMEAIRDKYISANLPGRAIALSNSRDRRGS